MRHPLKSFARKAAVLLGILFVLDFGLGSVLEFFFLREKQGDSSKTTYAVTGVTEDIIIFGSSRAAHHYVSESIAEVTGMNCFNAGRDGMKLPYYYALMNIILSYHTPKVIVLDLTYRELSPEARGKTLVANVLLPYFDQRPVVEEVISEMDPAEAWKARFSKLYRFNSLPVSIIQHHLGIGQKHRSGYEPLSGTMDSSAVLVVNEAEEPYHEDPALVAMLESFIGRVKERGIKLYVFISPTLSTETRNCKRTVARILKKHRMELYDYSGFLDITDFRYFRDRGHLNDSGARMFTDAILKEVIIPQGSRKEPEPPVPVQQASDHPGK